MHKNQPWNRCDGVRLNIISHIYLVINNSQKKNLIQKIVLFLCLPLAILPVSNIVFVCAFSKNKFLHCFIFDFKSKRKNWMHTRKSLNRTPNCKMYFLDFKQIKSLCSMLISKSEAGLSCSAIQFLPITIVRGKPFKKFCLCSSKQYEKKKYITPLKLEMRRKPCKFLVCAHRWMISSLWWEQKKKEMCRLQLERRMDEYGKRYGIKKGYIANTNIDRYCYFVNQSRILEKKASKWLTLNNCS